MEIIDLIEDATAKRGGTYVIDFEDGLDIHPAILTIGYLVSRKGGRERVPELDEGEIEEFLYTLDTDREYFGLWQDDEGLWSIDRTVWFSNREWALSFAASNAQRAIWDVASATEIVVQ